MNNIEKTINQKKQFFKNNEYKYGTWRKMWRYWRRAYIDSMLADGFDHDIANYYNDLLTRRYDQSNRIREERRFIDYWLQYAEDKPPNHYTRSNNEHTIEFYDKYLTFRHNEYEKLTIFPNNYVMSDEMVNLELEDGNLESLLIRLMV